MEAKYLRWMFVVVLLALVFWGFFAGPTTLGVSTEWSGNSYRCAGGTHPVALGFALYILVFYAVLVFSPVERPGQPLPGVVRRSIAYWLDFILAMTAITPIIGLLPALAEWRRTGAFAWNFARASHAPGDAFLNAVVLVLSLVALLFYYTFPLVRIRPSPGTCIMGYQIVPMEGVRLTPGTALGRTLLGITAVMGAYLAPFVVRDKKNGQIWLDKIFRTRAMRLT